MFNCNHSCLSGVIPSSSNINTATLASAGVAAVAAIVTIVAVITLFVPTVGAFLLGSLFTTTVAIAIASIAGVAFLTALTATIGLWSFNPSNKSSPRQSVSLVNAPPCYVEMSRYPEVLAAIDYFKKTLLPISQNQIPAHTTLIANNGITIAASTTIEDGPANGCTITHRFKAGQAKIKDITIVCQAGKKMGFEITDQTNITSLKNSLILLIACAQIMDAKNWVKMMDEKSNEDLFFHHRSIMRNPSDICKKLPFFISQNT